MRRAVALAAICVVGGTGTSSAAALELPAWARPLVMELSRGMQRPNQTVVSAPLPMPVLPPTVRGFTCYIEMIGSVIGGGGASPCGRPAIALPILSP